MNRRELIKAIVPAAMAPTLIVNSETKAAAVEIPPGHYMLFADCMAVDIDQICATPAPPGVWMEVHPIRLRPGQSAQDVVALYKLPDGKVGSDQG